MQHYVLSVDLLGKHHAVLVVAGYARPMAVIALRREKIIRRYETDARAAWRVSGVGYRVPSLGLEPGDARIFHAPLLVRCLAGNGRLVPDLVDVLAIGGDGEGET